MRYCPKCGSRLYPADEEYMRVHGKCSYCCTYPAVKTYIEEEQRKRKGEEKS